MNNRNSLLFLIVILMMMGTSCKDNEDVYNGEYTYYLSIQSEVMLHLTDDDDAASGMNSESTADRLSSTIYFMKQAVSENETMQGNEREREAALLTTCDSLYRNYAETNPENKGHVVCFVKLIRCKRNNGTVTDAVTMKYYQFWKEIYEGDGNGSGGSDDPNHYFAKPDSLKAIDLGLSVLWANCNFGARLPRNYGAHVAWGDSTGVLNSAQGIGWNGNSYTWNTDNYGGINPPADISGSELDVVANYWGEGWRIPTVEEAKELCEQCQWKLQAYGDIKWYEVIGPNGNSIIMPLAGLYGDDMSTGHRFQAGPYGVNEKGYYWTATSCTTPGTAEQRGYSVNEDVVTAWIFRFNSNNGDNLTPVFADHLRAMHMSIRPVQNK